MDIPNIKMITLSGKRLSLKEDLQEAVQFLEENRYLILKDITDLFSVKSILLMNKLPIDTIKKDIILNNISKAFISRFSLV